MYTRGTLTFSRTLQRHEAKLHARCQWPHKQKVESTVSQWRLNADSTSCARASVYEVDCTHKTWNTNTHTRTHTCKYMHTLGSKYPNISSQDLAKKYAKLEHRVYLNFYIVKAIDCCLMAVNGTSQFLTQSLSLSPFLSPPFPPLPPTSGTFIDILGLFLYLSLSATSGWMECKLTTHYVSEKTINRWVCSQKTSRTTQL